MNENRVGVFVSLVVTIAVVGSVFASGAAPAQNTIGDRGPFPVAAVEEIQSIEEPPTSGAAADVRFEGTAEAAVRTSPDDEVAVGVIGSSFNPSDPAIADHVVASRQSDSPGLFRTGTHDTAVAEIVTKTASDADLYLAGIGRQPTPEEYRAAIEWLVANDVDVIVDAGSYFPRTAAARKRLASATEYAAENGVVFVTSAGNYADSHWRGTSSERGWVEFANKTEANLLGDGAISGQVTLRLYWDSVADYDLYLFRDTPGPDDPVIASSTRREGRAEAIDTVVPEGEYYVAVYNHGGTSAKVDLFAAHHSLRHADANTSTIRPAEAEGIIIVGAADADGYKPYSSRSVDVAAGGGIRTEVEGTFRGTSAAAPVVAGTVALVEAEAETLTPAETERLIERTATIRGGVPQVDAAAAVKAARERHNESATDSQPTQYRQYPVE